MRNRQDVLGLTHKHRILWADGALAAIRYWERVGCGYQTWALHQTGWVQMLLLLCCVISGKPPNLSVSSPKSATKKNLYLIGSLGFNELINEKYFEEGLANSKHLSITYHHNLLQFLPFKFNYFFIWRNGNWGWLPGLGRAFRLFVAMPRPKPVFNSHSRIFLPDEIAPWHISIQNHLI